MAAQEDSQVLLSQKSRLERLTEWKNLFLPSLILALVLAAIVGFYDFSASETGREQPVTTEPRGEIIADLDLEVIYRESDDQTGRTYFYQGRFLFDGIGPGKRPVGASQVHYLDYVTGALSADGWITAEDGGYYIQLVDPGSGEAVTEKLRLTSEGINNFSPSKILVEELRNDPTKQLVSLVAYVDQLNREHFVELIKPGDAVAAELLRDGEEVLTDAKGFKIVDNLIIRRIGGYEQIFQEATFGLSPKE